MSEQDLKDKLEELERDNLALKEENEMLITDGGSKTAEVVAKSEALQADIKKKDEEIQQLKKEKILNDISKQFPDIDRSLITGSTEAEMKQSAEKLNAVIQKAKDSAKKEKEDELTNKWGKGAQGPPPTQPPATPAPGSGDDKVIEELETAGKNEMKESGGNVSAKSIAALGIKQGVFKKK